jgi:hypothetical protein
VDTFKFPSSSFSAPVACIGNWKRSRKGVGSGESVWVSIQESQATELDRALIRELDWQTLSKFLISFPPLLMSLEVSSCQIVSPSLTLYITEI